MKLSIALATLLFLLTLVFFCRAQEEEKDKFLIEFAHHTVQPLEEENLLTHLRDCSKLVDWSSAYSNRVVQLLNRTTYNNLGHENKVLNTQPVPGIYGTLQLMIQLKHHSHLREVERILGQKIDYHVIPPQTYVIHGNIEPLSNALSNHKEELIEQYINWIGHVKPQYKSKLDFKDLNQLIVNKDETSASLQEPIELFVLLLSQENNKDSYFAEQFIQAAQQYFSEKNQVPSEAESQVEISLVSSTKLLVRVSHDIAHSVLEYLKDQELVLWIERKLGWSLSNHAGNEILQGDGSTPGSAVSEAYRKPLWAKGITGKGEIVGIGDTGIDWDMCFFHDPNATMTFNTPISDHRKLAGYYTVKVVTDGKVSESDTKDEADGHGTHVAGSVAGNMFSGAPNYDTLSKYAGVAKDAKIFFTDIQKSGSPGLVIPHDLSQDYFPIPYKAGARIHSNSWGCSVSILRCSYDCKCVWTVTTQYGRAGEAVSNSLCRSLFDGQDCCRVCNKYDTNAREVDSFSYNNDDMLIVFAAGNFGAYAKEGTLVSPGTAKNCLTVGASHTTNSNFAVSVDYDDYTSIFNQLILYDITTIAKCCNPVGFSSKDRDLIMSLCCPDTKKKIFADNKLYSRNNMAYFSSRGPSFDGRIKPDVVAPGFNVISTHSDGNTKSFQCGLGRPEYNNNAALMTNMGTSMATPLTSGSAALVRQYYKDRGISPNPSGPLVKATIIHSAQRLTGNVLLDGASKLQSLPKSEPNNISGFGLVSLLKVLSFEDSAFKLIVHDRETIEVKKQNTYCFRNTKKDNFKATLTWYDPPATPSAKLLLVNDLDLDVFFFKNGSEVSTRVPGNNNFKGDRVNNVEQSMISTVPEGDIIAVRVSAQRISRGDSQMYALVMTGSVEYLGDTCYIPPAPQPKPQSDTKLFIIIGVSSGIIGLVVLGVVIAIGAYLWKQRNVSELHEKTGLLQ